MILIPENINNITQQLVESLQQLKSDLKITVNSSKITYIKRTIENPKTRKEHNFEPYNIAKYNNKFISKVIEKLEIALGNTLIMEEIEISELTPDTFSNLKTKFPINYCYYQLGKHLNIQILYSKDSTRVFDKTTIQLLEPFIGKTNTTFHSKTRVDFSSASEKEYINTHNNQELKNNLHCNSKKKAFSVTLAAIGSVLVFKDVNFRNSSVHGKQVVIDQDRVCLAGIYKKKQISITRLVFFVAGGFSFHVALLVPLSLSLSLVAGTFIFASAPLSDHSLYGYLASLKCSLELLADQVFGILKKLGFIELVLSVIALVVFPLVVSVFVVSSLDMDIVLDGASVISAPPSQVINDTTTGLSLSSSKILTTKVGGLESKMMALKVLVESILNKLDYLCSNLSTSAFSTSQ
ncbi:hypothetical protein G9A89_023188 [Geosiphon pyriformis]|nr:hypothetical protein G9A89_023188 [Geosiphon pyriformis]